jgi:hypothetical protein
MERLKKFEELYPDMFTPLDLSPATSVVVTTTLLDDAATRIPGRKTLLESGSGDVDRDGPGSTSAVEESTGPQTDSNLGRTHLADHLSNFDGPIGTSYLQAPITAVPDDASVRVPPPSPPPEIPSDPTTIVPLDDASVRIPSPAEPSSKAESGDVDVHFTPESPLTADGSVRLALICIWLIVPILLIPLAIKVIWLALPILVVSLAIHILKPTPPP